MVSSEPTGCSSCGVRNHSRLASALSWWVLGLVFLSSCAFLCAHHLYPGLNLLRPLHRPPRRHPSEWEQLRSGRGATGFPNSGTPGMQPLCPVVF